MKLVSACLIGVNCNFKAQNWLNPKLCAEFLKGDYFPVCPEVLGGLTVPRVPSEIIGGDGADVLEGRAKVVSMTGVDVTEQYLKGAYAVLQVAKAVGADEALLIEKSPSCGCGQIFDGAFKEQLKPGDGVTAALLKKNGLKVTCIRVDKP
jgi:uncharacterized protein YbbK (DUF523 family)